jgi:hypothetical protein
MNWGYESEKKAWEYFKEMQIKRLKDKSWEKININQHPKYIRERIKNIKESQFGCCAFNWFNKG